MLIKMQFTVDYYAVVLWLIVAGTISVLLFASAKNLIMVKTAEVASWGQ